MKEPKKKRASDSADSEGKYNCFRLPSDISDLIFIQRQVSQPKGLSSKLVCS